MRAPLVLLLTLLLVPAAQAATPVGTLEQPAGMDGCVHESAASGCADARGLGGGGLAARVSDGLLVPGGGDNRVAVLRFTPAGTLAQPAGEAACVEPDDGTNNLGCRPASNLGGANAVAVVGAHAYVSTFNGIAALSYSPDTGLTPLPGATACLSNTAVALPENTVARCTDVRSLETVTGIAASADGRHVYATANPSGQPNDGVAILRRDPATGALTQSAVAAEGCATRDGTASGEGVTPQGCGGPVRGMDTPRAPVLSPDGATLYVAVTGGIVVLRRDAETGVLSQPAGAAGCILSTAADQCADGWALSDIAGLALAPDGRHLYASGAAGVAILAVAADGTLTQTGCVSPNGEVTDGAERCAVGYAIGAFGGGPSVSPDGRTVAVTGSPARNEVAFFDRAADGSLAHGPTACVSDDGVASGPAGGNDKCLVARGTGTAGVVFGPPERAYVVGQLSVAYLKRSVAPTCTDPAPVAADPLTPVTIAFSCSDGNGDPVTLTVAGPPAKGTATPTGTSVGYTANAGTSGADTFLVRPSDGVNLGPLATGAVTIAGTPPVTTPPGRAPLPAVTTKRLKPKKGKAALALACPAAAATDCEGTLTLGFAKKEKVGRKKKAKVRLLNRKGYDIAAGKTAKLTVKVKGKAKKALKRKASIKLKAALAAPARGELLANAATATVTLSRR